MSARILGLVAVGCALLAAPLAAHGVAQDDAAFFLTNSGPAIGPFMYLGAKHMFTGYDHLLFLVGVLFFLYRLRDIVVYVSLFTLGHSVTLLAGVLWGLRANPFIVDAIIGLSVVYKAFDNLDGFRRFLGFQPNTRLAVLGFGLFHGFGLATTLQEHALAREGLLTNMLSFNVGVELGQIVALTGVLLALAYWRTREGFLRHAHVANTLLMAGGFTLMGYQIVGYFVGTP
ncbi:MAG: HupE/UreJ family protein [Longimicrobiales bacterium]